MLLQRLATVRPPHVPATSTRSASRPERKPAKGAFGLRNALTQVFQTLKYILKVVNTKLLLLVFYSVQIKIPEIYSVGDRFAVIDYPGFRNSFFEKFFYVVYSFYEIGMKYFAAFDLIGVEIISFCV